MELSAEGEAVVYAWAAWDEHPSSRPHVVRRQETTLAWCDRWSLDWLSTHRQVQMHRQRGLSVRESVERIEELAAVPA